MLPMTTVTELGLEAKFSFHKHFSKAAPYEHRCRYTSSYNLEDEVTKAIIICMTG